MTELKLQDLKFCNTCRFFGEQNTCTNPTTELDFARQDMVTGKPQYIFCSVVRSSSFLCGHAGKWHVPKDVVSPRPECNRPDNTCTYPDACRAAGSCRHA